MRQRITALIIAAVLAMLAWELPQLRRALIYDVVHWDAVPTEPALIPHTTGAALPPAPHTRVVLVDGLSAEVAATMPAWQALCRRGLALTVDVGFPTVSLPVETALWSGLTQQQTGIVDRYERPLVPPLHGIPAQVRGSWAVAENHGWIVRSLGFQRTEPAAADPNDPVPDADPAGWERAWRQHALAAVASDTKLVFVHVLEVDTAGHQYGGDSLEYHRVALDADALIAMLLEADRGARWFLLSDHGHLGGAHGGHGGEERDVRQVQACIAGPTIVTGRGGGLVHVVDIGRAIADSVGARLDHASIARPLQAALMAPLGPDDALPAMTLARGAIAILLVAAGIALTLAFARRWWLAPWWFIAACLVLVMVHGEPTLSTPFIYKAAGRDMYLTWLPALPLAAIAIWFGVARTTVVRAVIAQLAFPLAAVCAALTASGSWSAVFGAEVAPVVPRYTAYCSPLLLMASHGAAVVALAVLATLVRPVFDRRARRGPPQTEPAAG